MAGETLRAGFLTCTTKNLLSDHDPEHSGAFYSKLRECSGFIRHIFVFKIINWEASRSQRLASKIKIVDVLFKICFVYLKRFLFANFMYVVFCLHVWLCTTCIRCWRKLEEGIRPLVLETQTVVSCHIGVES